MNAVLLTLTAYMAVVQSVATGYQTYNQVAPVTNSYAYSMQNNGGYRQNNNYFNNHYSVQPTSANSMTYGYQSNTQNSAMPYNNAYNINSQTTSTTGRNYGSQYTTKMKNSALAFLPLVMGGLEANELTTYSMMMNSGTNNALSYLMMNGENNDLMRMMALRRASQGGRRVNPYTMSVLFGMEL